MEDRDRRINHGIRTGGEREVGREEGGRGEGERRKKVCVCGAATMWGMPMGVKSS